MNSQKNRKYWQQIAEIYDRNVGERGDIRHEAVINPIVFNFLGNLKGKIVLDAASGNGYLSRGMAKSAEKVFGVDLTEALIQLAKRKDNPRNLEFAVGSIENLQFPNAMFGVVLCNMALMDVEKLDIVVKELGRVLKIGGILVISIIHPCFENPPKTYSLFDDKDNPKTRIGRVIKEYFNTGLVVDESQIVDNGEPYQHYHYMISDYLNAFARAGLSLEKTSEPNGSEIFKIAGNNDGGMSPDAPTFIIFKLRKI